MCGIWGIIGLYFKLSSAVLYGVFDSIKHRGPDRLTYRALNDIIPILLGFHRLSIMDVSTRGDQPFILEVGSRTIYTICNGEIYDFHDIVKKHLIETKSQSDCEIIPHLYSRYGIERTLKILVGSEFAFLIIDLDHDEQTVKVYAARDPLGVRPLYVGHDESSVGFSSELKGLVAQIDEKPVSLYSNITQFPSGHYMEVITGSDGIRSMTTVQYFSLDVPVTVFDLDEAKALIRRELTRAVVCRLDADRPIGFLLSGGLDSSLVSAISARYMDQFGKKIRTFCVGMEGGTDEEYAKMVSEFIGSEHTHTILTAEQFLEESQLVPAKIESYDTTTVRASTGQILATKSAHDAGIIVLLIGDGSDECCAGYIYFHYAPTPEDADIESKRLLKDIYMYDGQRADRGIASCGMEARVPFLDSRFVMAYLSIDPALRTPRHGREKWLLRSAFEGYLPDKVLWRRKEAFSDGVSGVKQSWHTILQEQASKIYGDIELPEYDHMPLPKSGPAESHHFRQLFRHSYGEENEKVVPYYLRPKWVTTEESSARALDIYSRKSETVEKD